MRQLSSILVALFVLSGTALCGVERLRDVVGPGGFDPKDSAALFVGVREFTPDKTLANVPYAVDDAIDLAYAASIAAPARLVEPKHVILSLSGKPQKAESQRRLEELLGAGATMAPTDQSNILALLESQSRSVGKKGILIVGFATHGISEDGMQYLFAASSLLQHRSTSISEAKIVDIVTRSGAPRSLILLDACRGRLTTGTREGEVDPRSAAARLRGVLGGIDGHVVFSAASVGNYAYDDDVQRNGVFTAAVVEGLRCGAATDAQGFVTVDTLSTYVEEQVLSWIQKHRDPQARKATQLQCEGRSKQMPLSTCPARKAALSDTGAAPPPRP